MNTRNGNGFKLRPLLTALLLSAPALTGAFSLFSMDHDPYGFETGEWVAAASPRFLAMGGAGSALADSVSPHLRNPASYAFTDYTLLSLTYAPEFTRLKDPDASSAFTRFSADFPNAEMDVPLGRFGLVFGGYRRERKVDYDITYKDDQGFTLHREGSGGLYTVFGGYGVNLKQRVSAGLSLGGVFGKIRTSQFILERPAGEYYLEPSRNQRTRFEGYLLDAGVTVRQGKFSAALALSLPVGPQRLTQEHQIIQNYTPEDSVVTLQNRSLEEDFLENHLTLGLGYRPLPRLQLAADAMAVLGGDSRRSAEYRIGMGAEIRLSEKPADNYFLNIPLRIGAYLYKPGYEEPVTEEALTFGLTLPTYRAYGLINLAVEGGRRTLTGDPSSLEETFAKFSVQIVHKARWGRLRRETTPGKRPDALQ